MNAPSAKAFSVGEYKPQSGLSPKLRSFHERLMQVFSQTGPEYAWFNLLNASRWYHICLESLERGDQKRMLMTFKCLENLASVAPNWKEAREYILELALNKNESAEAKDLKERCAKLLWSYMRLDAEDSVKTAYSELLLAKLKLGTKGAESAIVYLLLILDASQCKSEEIIRAYGEHELKRHGYKLSAVEKVFDKTLQVRSRYLQGYVEVYGPHYALLKRLYTETPNLPVELRTDVERILAKFENYAKS